MNFNFCFKCPENTELRNQLIKPYYFRKPSVFKLIQFLNTENREIYLCIGKFIKRSTDLGNSLM